MRALFASTKTWWGWSAAPIIHDYLDRLKTFVGYDTGTNLQTDESSHVYNPLDRVEARMPVRACPTCSAADLT